MYNSIILSSCLFGSFYLFSQSLEFINRLQLENKQLPYKLILINGFTVILSGSVIIYGFTPLKI
jgi:hypothetical protein